MPEELKNLGKFRDPEQMHKEYIDTVTGGHPELFDETEFKKDFDALFGVRYVKAGEYTKKEFISFVPTEKEPKEKKVKSGDETPADPTTEEEVEPKIVNKLKLNNTVGIEDNDWIIIQYAGKDIGYFENTNAGKEKLYDFLSYTVDQYLKEGERAQLYKTIADELATASIEYEASKLERSIANLQPGRESPATIKTRRKDSRDAEKDINNQSEAMADLLAQQLATLQEQFNLLNQKHDDLENTSLQNSMNVLLERVVKLRKALSLAKYNKEGSDEIVMITYNIDGTTYEQTADEVDAEIKDLQTKIDAIASEINETKTRPVVVPAKKGTKGGPSVDDTDAVDSTTTTTTKIDKTATTATTGKTAPGTTTVIVDPLATPGSTLTVLPGTAGVVDIVETEPLYDVFKFEFWDGSESARSYLTYSGIPESHLDRFSDADTRDVKKLNNTRALLDEFKLTALKIQTIYLSNPSLNIPPADVSKNPLAKDIAYREIASLYNDLQRTDFLMAKQLTKRVSGTLFTYHLLNDEDKEWSDVLMGKKKDVYTWRRFSPDYGRARIYSHDNIYDLGPTQGSETKSHEVVANGREGLVTRARLMDAPLVDLMLMANRLSADDASIEAQTIRLAMLERMIGGGSTAPELNPDGSIRHVPLEEMITMLGDGDKALGHNRYWELMRAVMMNEKFQQDFNVTYTNALKVTRAQSAEKLQANKSNYLHDYFQFPDPNQEDALLLNAFTYTLSKQMIMQGGERPITGTELKYLFDMYKGADGVLDASEPATRIREIYNDNTPNRDLGAANTRDVFKAQGVNGALRIGVLTPLIEKGIISSKTASNISSFANGAVNVAKFGVGIAAIVNGVVAAWHTGAGIFKWMFNTGDSKASFDSAGKSLKRGVMFGLGYEGIKFLQKPNEYREKSVIRDVWALFDPDLADKMKQDQQIQSKELISVYTKRRALNQTIGTMSPNELIAKGILTQGNGPDKIAIDMDQFVSEFPVMERELQKEGGRPAVKQFLKELEKFMVNEYKLNWTELQAMKGSAEPLNKTFNMIDIINIQVNPINDLFIKEFGKGEDIDVLLGLPEVERQERIERMAFVAQQLNKFTQKKLIEDYLIDDPTQSDKGLLWASMRRSLDGPKSIDGATPMEGIKIGLQKFLNKEIDVNQYFQGVGAVFAEIKDPTDTTKVLNVKLYDPIIPAGVTTNFTTYLHDPNVGNSPFTGSIVTPGAKVYVLNPRIGVGSYATPTPFDYTTQSWKVDLFK